MTEAASIHKILLVTPPYHSGIPEIAGRWMPLGLVYLAGAARQAGVSAEIYDAMSSGDGYPEIEQQLRNRKADYLAVGAMTATINDALKTLELAKRVDSKTVTLLGGVHPSFMFREILELNRSVDYIIVGEGEESLRRLLLVLEQGGDPATVPGLAYRVGDQIVVTRQAELIDDLDALPAAWDLLDWQQYRYLIIPDSRFAAISTSRGCSNDCVFCSQQQFWQKSWRPRDPGKVADELAYLYSTYQANVFLITDEYPTCDPRRWEAFLDALIEKGLPIHLIMETRADDIIRDREILWKYRKAGVVHISIGIEATDQQTLDRIGKGISVDAAKQALDLIHEQDIVSEASFLIGFPEETAASVQETLKMAQHYNPDNANFFALTPWPYGGMYQELKPYLRESDYARYNFIDPVLEPKQMSISEVEAALVECYRKFYMGKIMEVMTMKDTFRRGYLVRATKLIMSSSFVLRKLNPLQRAGKRAAAGET